MAEKPSSRIRFDEIVNAVHADPAKVEPVVMLSGYLGRSNEKGNIRIYPEPSLSCWYEVAESDVVHAAPLDDSPLGGSNVWVRGSAKITPSIPIPPPVEAKEGEFAESDADKPQAALADTGVFNPMAAVHPTIWTQFCPTGVGCIATVPCLPPSVGCPPDGGLGQVGPTGTQGCTFVHCPVGQTGWHTCACPIGPTGWHTCACPIGPTGWHTCACPIGPTGWRTCACPIGPTGTQGCTPPHAALAQAQAQALPHTAAATICTQAGCGVVGPAHTILGCLPHQTAQTRCFICDPPITSPVHSCIRTRSFDCVGTAPPTFGCPTESCPTRAPFCGPSLVAICPSMVCENQVFERQVNPTASTHCFICPPLTIQVFNPTASTRCFICPPDAGQWAAGGVQAAAMVGPTGTQGCTQPGHCVGQTGWHTCGCPIGPTGTQGCTQAFGCPSTSTCPPEAYGAMNTAATLCTRHPACAQEGMPGPTGTQGCTQPPHCIGQTGWRTCACPEGGQMQAAAMVGPTGTHGCTQADCRIGNTGWRTCACPVGQTSWHTCACPIGKTGWQTCACPVITLLTVSGCQQPSWVDACPTRLGCQQPSWVDACPTRLCMTIAGPCMTIAGPCLPFTWAVEHLEPPNFTLGC